MKYFGAFLGAVFLSSVMSLPTLAQSAGSQQENTAPQQQQNSNSQQSNSSATRTTKSVTGCLEKGDKAGAYSIKTDNGATWVLKSRKVDLSEHVGHQVTATGFLAQHQTSQTPSTPNTTVDNSQDESGAGGAGTINTLHVTRVKMVSESCAAK